MTPLRDLDGGARLPSSQTPVTCPTAKLHKVRSSKHRDPPLSLRLLRRLKLLFIRSTCPRPIQNDPTPAQEPHAHDTCAEKATSTTSTVPPTHLVSHPTETATPTVPSVSIPPPSRLRLHAAPVEICRKRGATRGATK